MFHSGSKKDVNAKILEGLDYVLHAAQWLGQLFRKDREGGRGTRPCIASGNNGSADCFTTKK